MKEGSKAAFYIALVLCVAFMAGAGYLYMELSSTQTELSSAQQERDEFQARLRSESRRLADLEKTLGEKQQEITGLNQQLSYQKSLIEQKNQEIADYTAAIEEHKQAMTEHEEFKMQLKTAEERKQQLERDLAATKRKYNKELKQLQERKLELEQKLQQMTGEIPGAVKIENVRILTGKKFSGKVVAVNTEYNFVAINIGKNDGMEEGTVLIVHRGKKLVTKARVARVYETNSVADLLDEWKQDKVKKGDGVKKF